MNISRLRGQILVKSLFDGVQVLFEILRARGPGKSGVKVRGDDTLARENRSRSAGAERERFEALSRRVSIDRACRDPARRGPGESAVSSGDVRLIERDTLLAGVFADIRLSHAWFGNFRVARALLCEGDSFIEEPLVRRSSLRLFKPPARKHG